MARTATACLLALLTFGSAGCGTVANVVCSGSDGMTVYSGVLGNLARVQYESRQIEIMQKLWEQSKENNPGTLGENDPGTMVENVLLWLWVADMPLSAVADTALLPVTIPCTLWQLQRRQPDAEPSAFLEFYRSWSSQQAEKADSASQH
jgi:hypothetical protein